MADRIVSLIPSGTEIVDALGCIDRVVGRSHECDHPPGIETRPVCTSAKVDPTATSIEIDRTVRSLVENALSVYRVHDDVLRELRPDVIVTQSQCELCAVSEADVAASVARVLGSDTTIISMEAADLGGLWRDIEKVGTAVGVDPAPTIDALRARLDTAHRSVPEGARPTVACLEWLDPLMFAGNWVPELVDLAGGRDLFAEPGSHSTTLSWEDVREADPDVVILMPCGYDLPRTLAEVPLLTRLDGWRDLRAAREGRVFATDGNHFFNRPGPRLVDSLEILVEILHQDGPSYGFEGTTWQVANSA